jgi:trehalose 6-phosphate synthase/phosphatase
VNPWNINDVAAAIEDALTMSEEERRERHRQNFMHVATHTAQVGMHANLKGMCGEYMQANLTAFTGRTSCTWLHTRLR